ncbi:MAG: aldehyde dehydrogenase family protein [Xanthobacteraceae bacterium]|nr:aldehyde dehydrogenase family protein [Xanthobacteraceae bacterium]QYK44387.1 MAG: aldehyde dehydrogenase family protein [Xanthobacteraceae bacterium]
MNFPQPLDTLSADCKSTLTAAMKPMDFKAGTAIFHAGDKGDGCYIVEKGDVRIELGHSEHVDTDSVLDYARAGQLFGEFVLLDGKPRPASAIAETDVKAYFLSAQAIDDLAKSHPSLALNVVRALGRDASEKLRQAATRLETFLESNAPDPEVDEMVAKAKVAQAEFENWPEEKVDALLLALASAIAEQALPLAEATVKETKLGNVTDKTTKNAHAALGVYQSLAGKTGRGILKSDDKTKIHEVATPAGVVFGLVPVTNPVATAIFKTLIALKARCALILSFHRACLGVGNTTCEIMQKVLKAHGAPENIVQWVKARGSRTKTVKFMSHPDVSLVLATGGAGMVRAAYSSGTPALGVGPGNAPTFIAADANIPMAAYAIVVSKPFDNGLICGGEHNLVVDTSVRAEFVKALEQNGAAVLNDEERKVFLAKAVDPKKGKLIPIVVGQSAQTIANVAGIKRDYPIKLIVVPMPNEAVAQKHAMAGEKLTPILSLFTVNDDQEGFRLSRAILDGEGAGHTAIIHTQSDALAQQFGLLIPASRILVNSPGVQGVSGLTTALCPSFTLGCGTFGGNSTTDNVSFSNLQNVKRLAYFIPPATMPGAA